MTTETNADIDTTSQVSIELNINSKPYNFQVSPHAIDVIALSIQHEAAPVFEGLILTCSKHVVTLFMCCPGCQKDSKHAFNQGRIKSVYVRGSKTAEEEKALLCNSDDYEHIDVLGIQLIELAQLWPDQSPRISYCQSVPDAHRNRLNRVVSFGYPGRQVLTPPDAITFEDTGPLFRVFLPGIRHDAVRGVRLEGDRVMVDHLGAEPSRFIVFCASPEVAQRLSDDLKHRRVVSLGVNNHVRSIVHTPAPIDIEAQNLVLIIGEENLPPPLTRLLGDDPAAFVRKIGGIWRQA